MGAAERYADLLRKCRALFVYTTVFLEGFFIWGVMTYLGSFATRRYGLDQLAVGLLIALFGIGTMAGGLFLLRKSVANQQPCTGIQCGREMSSLSGSDGGRRRIFADLLLVLMVQMTRLLTIIIIGPLFARKPNRISTATMPTIRPNYGGG